MDGLGNEPKCIVVVGGANTDIVGHTFAPLVAHDSNPGYVSSSAGGVGRNIAENLVRLGAVTVLITAFGADRNAHDLADECRRSGIGIDHAVTATDLPGSAYVAILDADGEMALALNDMRALDLLTLEALQERRDALAGASLIVLDANIPADSLEWLVTEVEVPILLDPVSAAKASRVRPLLDRLSALKCNALEAAALLGMPELKSPAQVEYAAEKLLEAGVGSVYVTAGVHGVRYHGPGQVGWLERPSVPVVNATGAGDAFCAGVAAGMLEDMEPRECAAFGTAMAGLTLATDRSVSHEVEYERARAEMEAIL